MEPFSRPVWLSKFELAPGTGKWVFVPDEATKEYGRKLKEEIEAHWQPPDYFVHLGTRGHVRALGDHLSNSYFARIDLKSFFGSIGKTRITRNLSELFRNYKKARAAAVMSTVPVKRPGAENPAFVLPFGFVQSPLLATLCLANSKLGTALEVVAKSFTLSVYVDDILISTSDSVASLGEAFEKLKTAAIASKFELNIEKLSPPASRTTVFNINLERLRMRISDERLSKFQARLPSADTQVLNGILGYVRSVNPDQAQQLAGTIT